MTYQTQPEPIGDAIARISGAPVRHITLQADRHSIAIACAKSKSVMRGIQVGHRAVAYALGNGNGQGAGMATDGPVLVKGEFCAIGPFAEPFAGTPAGAAGNTK